MAKRTFAFVAVFAALLSVTLSVQAEDLNYYWAGGSGSNYFTTANWRIGSESGSVATAGLGNTANSITAYIRNSNSVNISLDYSNLGGAVKTLNIGEIGGTAAATITRSGGTFNIEPNKTINVFNNGTFSITQGFTIDANGKMTVDGGTVSDTGSGLVVNGTLDIKRGTFTFNNSGNQIHGNGTINVTGGTFNVVASNSLRIGNAANSTLNISGGEVTVSSPSYIGVSDYTGTINQSGGNVTFNGELDFGWGNGAVGEYNLTGGTMTTTANAGLWTGNPSGISSFTVGGGTANFTKSGESFTVGLGGTNQLKNVFTITSGTVNVTDTFAVKYTGILNINGGEFNAPTITVDSVSTLNMTGGSLKTNAINMNGGTFTQGGGSLVYNGKLTVTGSAVLNGTIDMSKFLGAYNQTVDVIEATSITGSPSISGDWTIANDGTKITATYTGGAGKYYWTGATNNTYNTGTNWSINGAQYTETYITGSPATFDKDCYILTSNGAVDIDWGDFGVASLTVGNGVGGSTGAAEISRGGDEELKTQLTINKGGTATFGGAFSITSYNGTPATLTVNGGDFNASSSTTVSGKIVVDDGNYNANGAVTVNSGGSITISGGKFTYASGSNFVNNGTMTLSDDGEFVVNSGSGTFRVGGSSNDAEFKITGGKATFNTNVYIATSSEGTINQSGGETVFNSRLILGWGNYGGTYNLTGGTLNANNAAGLWNANSSGVSTFNVEGGVANFKNSGESFTIGLSNDGTQYTGLSLANVFNLKSGTVNAADTFAIQYSGTLNVGQSGAGDGVLNAKGITLNNSGKLNMSSGTINLGSGGITSSDNDYTITLSGGTFGNNGADWSSALTATLSASSTTTFSPGEDQKITWSGVLSGSGAISKTGAGTLELSGTNTSFSGGITVSAGKLLITGNSVGTGKTTNNGAIVEFFADEGETITITNQVGNYESGGVKGKTIKTGAGTLSTNNWISGQVEVQEGTLKLTNNFDNGKRFNGVITINQNAILDCAEHDSLGWGSANTKIRIYGLMDNSVRNETLNNTELHMYGGTAKSSGGGNFDVLNAGVKFYSYALTGATASAPTVSTISSKLVLRHNGTLNIDTEANSQLNLAGEITGLYNSTQYTCSIVKLGAGTLNITAGNNYTGGTTISAGTLVLSGDGTLGTGTVANNATLEFAHTANLTGDNAFANVISGSGVVNKTGAGTLELTGANAYSGKTTISAGTLKLSGSGTLGTGNVTNNATLEFAYTDNKTFSKVISGTGSVTKTGAGTLTLSGANTYSGDTTISAGTLKLNGSTATLGAGAVTIAENAALEISGAPRGLHSVTSLSGSGDINITGTGNSFLSLANANAQEYNGTINVTGKLHIGYQDSNNKDRYTNLNLPNATVSLSTSGAQLALDQDDNNQDTTTLTIKTLNGVAGTYIRAGGQALYFDPPGYSTITVGDGVFQGVIGTNTTSYPCFNNISLIKNTTGTLTLSGANTYTGGTTVSEGVLELTGDAIVANGQVYVDTNGTLKYSWNGSGDKTLTIDAVAKKIYGTGKVIVNADEEAVLKIYTSAKGMIDVQSLTISSGRVDIKDYFDGQLIVQGQGTFSPGNSVGTLIIGDGTYGDGGFILNEAGAELLMEIGGAAPSANDGLIVNGDITFKDGSVITLVNNSNLGLGKSFTAILSADNSANLDVLGHIQTTDFTELKYVQINDATHGTVYAITGRTLNANEIPEPSTWALLILGAAGLLYWRKKKNA